GRTSGTVERAGSICPRVQCKTRAFNTPLDSSFPTTATPPAYSCSARARCSAMMEHACRARSNRRSRPARKKARPGAARRRGSAVLVTGVGSVVRELQLAVRHDFLLLATVALVFIFLVVMAMLRAPLAALAVVATVILSYVSAIGLSVVYWQFVIGRELHW